MVPPAFLAKLFYHLDPPRDSRSMRAMRLRHASWFWLGFFPLVILLWAWADSQTNASYWRRAPGTDPVQIRQVLLWKSAIVLSRSDLDIRDGDPAERDILFPATPKWGKADREVWTSPPAGSATGPLFPAFREGGGSKQYRRGFFSYYGVTIPLWMILLPYLPLWLGAAWWQARRIARKHAAAMPVAAEDGDERAAVIDG